MAYHEGEDPGISETLSIFFTTSCRFSEALGLVGGIFLKEKSL